MTVYISGGITGVPNFKEKFRKAERHLRETGFDVINPSGLKDNVLIGGFDYGAYMNICLLLLEAAADCIYLLDGWEKSDGAKEEKRYAERCMKEVITEQEEREKGEMVWMKCF